MVLLGDDFSLPFLIGYTKRCVSNLNVDVIFVERGTIIIVESITLGTSDYNVNKFDWAEQEVKF